LETPDLTNDNFEATKYGKLFSIVYIFGKWDRCFILVIL